MGGCTQDCRTGLCDFNEVKTDIKLDQYDSIRQAMPLIHTKLDTWVSKINEFQAD